MADPVSDEKQPEGTGDQPVLRVLTPNATPEEIAAIVAVVSASASVVEPAPEPTREWNAPHRLVRHPVAESSARAGRGGWRASGLPR